MNAEQREQIEKALGKDYITTTCQECKTVIYCECDEFKYFTACPKCKAIILVGIKDKK